MGYGGYFAYRYKRTYYRQFLQQDSSPYGSGHGRRLASAVPRDPSAFKDWVVDRITMLKNAKICEIDDPYDGDVVRPDDGVGADDLGYNAVYDLDLEWFKFSDRYVQWTYTIDLDNLVFTINGTIHLRLDNMPPDLEDYSYCEGGDNPPVPQEYLCAKVNLWPAPGFDTGERQQKYEALQPIIIPVAEWGAPTWHELTASQRFSVEITHYLLHRTSPRFTYAYAPFVRRDIGQFCWNVLCASVPALPIFQEDNLKGTDTFRALSCGWTNGLFSVGAYARMFSLENGSPFKSLIADYCWIRGCLVTFCVHFEDPIYVAHEVEQMVQRMRRDGHPESVGIILSSQQELVVVAMDGPVIRHSPVLDIRTAPRGERPGRATDGRLLLTYLLSPPLTVSPLPWRQSLTVSAKSATGLPLEVLQIIIDHLDIRTYISMCCVSRSIRSVCVAHPRVGNYTVLHRVPGFMSIFAVQSVNHELKKIKLQWRSENGGWVHWKTQEVSPEEFNKLKRERNKK